MLIAQKQEQITLAIMGANFTFAPISRPMVMRARRAGGATLTGEGDADLDEFGNAVSLALLVEGITAWDGVALPIGEDEDAEGAVELDGVLYRLLDCTPENKELLLADSVIFDALDAAYVAPFVTRERAKNGPAGSSDGISSRVTPDKTTAVRRAETKRRAPTASAKPGAKRARTPSTRSKTKTSS